MSIVWEYGLTTVPKRITDGTLQKTLESLNKAGFTNPRLFIDGLPNSELGEFSKLRITCHSEAIRIYGNFHLGLSELYIRNPNADRFAMFQDDFVTYPGLREYLEQCEYPTKGYWNLYTFPENQKPKDGWYLSNQLGKGAVALVFNNDAVRTLLNSTHWINRHTLAPKDNRRTWKFIDGGIVEAMRQAGYKEYVHNPSLVQHTGLRSTLGNSRHALTKSFKGEQFNAMSLVKRPAPHIPTEAPTDTPLLTKPSRVGLVGTVTKANRQIAENANVYRWLVKPDPIKGVSEVPEDIDFIPCPFGHKLETFLEDVDLVVYTEPTCYPDLLIRCRAACRKTVIIEEPLPSNEAEWQSLNERIKL